MTGLGHKIKDALTPGHKNKHANQVDNTYGTEPSPMGTAAPIGTNTGAGTYNTGINDGVAGTHTGGMGGNLVSTGRQGSSSSSSSSDDEGVAGVRRTGATGTTGACETRTFTEVEDRPVMRERVERIVEHRPVEKQFVVETRPVGEREVADGVHYESAGVREYEVDRVGGSKCPTGTGAGAGTNTVL